MITKEELLANKTRIEKLLKTRLEALKGQNREEIRIKTFKLVQEIKGIEKALETYEAVVEEMKKKRK
jgi:hypothetical protein